MGRDRLTGLRVLSLLRSTAVCQVQKQRDIFLQQRSKNSPSTANKKKPTQPDSIQLNWRQADEARHLLTSSLLFSEKASCTYSRPTAFSMLLLT